MLSFVLPDFSQVTESSLRLEHRGSGSPQFDEESSKSFNLALVRQDLTLTASLALNLQQFLLLQPPKFGGCRQVRHTWQSTRLHQTSGGQAL